MRLPFVALALLAAGSMVAACERPRQPARADSGTTAAAPPATPPDTTTPPPPASMWDSSAGAVMLVHGDSPSEATVVFPRYTELFDTTKFSAVPLRAATFEVLDQSGQAHPVKATGLVPEDLPRDCASWPRATLVPGAGARELPAWSVGFVTGSAKPIPLVPIERLSRTDSARVAAEVTRMASALPNDTSPALRGVPYHVRAAYRFSPAPGVDAVVAEVVRTLNQEANPVQEHIRLVGERDSADASPRYRTAYFSRVSGGESQVVSTEVLAAVILGANRRPSLLLDSIGYEGDTYVLLERTATGQWRVRWSSAYAGC